MNLWTKYFIERLCETKLDLIYLVFRVGQLSPSVRKAEKYAAGAYFLIFMSCDVVVTPGPTSSQVPLSAGRCHLKSQFFCAVAQHLAGSTMRYLWSLGGCVCCWPVSRVRKLVMPGWQQFCLIHEQAMWY